MIIQIKEENDTINLIINDDVVLKNISNENIDGFFAAINILGIFYKLQDDRNDNTDSNFIN